MSHVLGRAATVAILLLPVAYGLVFGDIWSLAFVTPYAVMGGVLAIRRPRNAIGWLLIGIAASFALATPRSLDPSAVTTSPVWALVVVSGGTWGWTVVVALVMALTVIFPSGRVPARPRGLAVAMFVIAVATITLSITAPTVPVPTSDGAVVTIQNPLALSVGGDRIDPLAQGPDWLFAVVISLLAAGVAWLLVRARRAVGAERLQYRWLVATLALFALALAAGFAVTSMLGYADADPRVADPSVLIAWLPALLASVAVPVAIAVAILRYRLFDIDRIISQTLTYASVTLVLFVAFASINLGLQQVISPIVGGNAAATAISTLVVAALFDPVRTRIQRAVDRRFHRARYDAERMIDAFAGRLRDEVDLTRLVAELGGVSVEAVDPSSVRVWIRAGVRT